MRVIYALIVSLVLGSSSLATAQRPAQQRNRATANTERPFQQGLRHQQFQEERLKYIITEAALTEEEGAWLKDKLAAYDAARVNIWQERGNISEKLATAAGSDFTNLLNEWVTLETSMREVHLSFITDVRQKFSDEKALKIMVSQRLYNGRAGQQARSAERPRRANR